MLNKFCFRFPTKSFYSKQWWHKGGKHQKTYKHFERFNYALTHPRRLFTTSALDTATPIPSHTDQLILDNHNETSHKHSHNACRCSSMLLYNLSDFGQHTYCWLVERQSTNCPALSLHNLNQQLKQMTTDVFTVTLHTQLPANQTATCTSGCLHLLCRIQ